MNEPVEIFVSRKRLVTKGLFFSTLFSIICCGLLYRQFALGLDLFPGDRFANLFSIGMLMSFGFVFLLGLYLTISEEFKVRSQKRTSNFDPIKYFRVFYADQDKIELQVPYGKKSIHKWREVKKIQLIKEFIELKRHQQKEVTDNDIILVYFDSRVKLKRGNSLFKSPDETIVSKVTASSFPLEKLKSLIKKISPDDVIVEHHQSICFDHVKGQNRVL
ncbi:MAG: hypothetical protein KC493_11055 [Bacteriovoracaceae bacterium]|nr:hypothetical protein [Bacteriovoracaceae bacterium]